VDRYEAIVLDQHGAEFVRYFVHADTQAQADEQALAAFRILYRDKDPSSYKVQVRFSPMGSRH
jgi:hypothetical protein